LADSTRLEEALEESADVAGQLLGRLLSLGQAGVLEHGILRDDIEPFAGGDVV